jgi:hypothetical protein
MFAFGKRLSPPATLSFAAARPEVELEFVSMYLKKLRFFKSIRGKSL